ncbi:MAG: hypothetical protein GJV46_04455 [Geobacter sp.]|nr:hypothetical protein [Geobacter sp.]
MRRLDCVCKMKPIVGLLFLLIIFALPVDQVLAAYNVNISGDPTANGVWSGATPDVWTPSGTGANLSVADIRTRLNGGTGVVITTAGAGSEAGNININAATSWNAGTLTLTAHNDININAVMSASNTAGLAMNYGWNGNTAAPTYSNQGGIKVGFAPGEAQGFVGRVDFPGRSGIGFLKINGDNYTVIDSLGEMGSVTALDLQGINGNLAGKYALGADIDAFMTGGWNIVAGFMPIGDSYTNSFNGVFDGLGHTVTSLFINRPNTVDVGLFGFGLNSTVRNVGLVGGSVKGKYNVGGLAGSNQGVIGNCYNSGVVLGDQYVGGLVGENSAVIDSSYATGAVSGVALIGGLAGDNVGGSLSNSYAIGSVSGSSDHIGGLVGLNVFGAKISDAYAAGSVNFSINGRANVGGLVGENYYSSTIINSYSVGSVNGGTDTGGVVGLNDSTPSVTNSFWDTQTTGQAISAGGSGKTSAEMKQLSTFTGWNIDTSDSSSSLWRITNGQSYPLLRTFVPPLSTVASNAATSITSSSATLNGSVNARYADASVSFEYGLTTSYGASTAAAPATVIVGNGNTTVTADLSGLTPGLTYHYRVVATNSAGTAYGNDVQFVVLKAAATVTLDNLAVTYDGTPKSATATTNPAGKNVIFTYDGSSTVPVNAGSYAVVGTINDINYQGSASGTLVIGKATATITLGGLVVTYDGTAKGISATTVPSGKNVVITYDGSSTAPANSGSYAVIATVSDGNYQGSASGTLVIGKASATVTLGDLVTSYDGTAKSASATTSPSGKTVIITYDGGSTAPVNAGSYAVVGTISDANYQGSASGTLLINPPTLTVAVAANGTLASGTGGTVTSTPSGISCANSVNGTLATCDKTFSGTVSLYATPSVYSLFGGWGGACSGLGACSVNMTGGKTVTATFNQAPLLHIDGTIYPSLQAAYNAATDGAFIQLLDNTVAGVLDANRNISVKLKGGYDAGYGANAGTTAVTAPLTIRQGTLVADRIVIR